MNDKAIVRNRAKIEAACTNARAVLNLREHGGLDALIWSHKPDETPVPRTSPKFPPALSKALAANLRSRGFRFVSSTTAYALMEAIGMIDTHLTGCHRRGSSEQIPLTRSLPEQGRVRIPPDATMTLDDHSSGGGPDLRSFARSTWLISWLVVRCDLRKTPRLSGVWGRSIPSWNKK